MGEDIKLNFKQIGATRQKAALSGVHCPRCSAEVPDGAEFCPSCGARLVSYCTFCGAPMAPSETVCEECGMPLGGVRCPSCGSVNQRPFCRVCNAPLTRAAVRAVELAREDPVFRKCEELAAEVAEIEREMEEDTPEPQKAEELRSLKKAKAADLDALLAEMIPPVGATPQEQVVFYSARKVEIKVRHRETVRVGWVCNFCGCTHSKPSECARPMLGGRWITEEIETEETIYDYEK